MGFFDPSANLPERLQQTIDSWRADPPASQFEMYGPLNAYLQFKFCPNKFLVKPRASLREEDPTPNNIGEESDGSSYSVDSLGVPDFTICQYWGANDDADIIRILVEVSDDKVVVEQRVRSDLDMVGDRARGRIIGVAIVGNEVAIWAPKHNGLRNLWGGFISLFDPKFVQELDKMLSYSLRMDSDP